MHLLNCPAGTITVSSNDSIFISNGTSAMILNSVLCGGPVFFNNLVCFEEDPQHPPIILTPFGIILEINF